MSALVKPRCGAIVTATGGNAPVTMLRQRRDYPRCDKLECHGWAPADYRSDKTLTFVSRSKITVFDRAVLALDFCTTYTKPR
jgi:hypothetical protein